MAGYSDKHLFAKLGFRVGDHVLAIEPPSWYVVELEEAGIATTNHLPATWVHAFFTWREDVERFLKTLSFDQIEKGLWVSWPKKASGVETDLTEQTFRDLILPHGWVDIKVAAVDEIWSGLKFTRRKT